MLTFDIKYNSRLTGQQVSLAEKLRETGQLTFEEIRKLEGPKLVANGAEDLGEGLQRIDNMKLSEPGLTLLRNIVQKVFDETSVAITFSTVKGSFAAASQGSMSTINFELQFINFRWYDPNKGDEIVQDTQNAEVMSQNYPANIEKLDNKIKEVITSFGSSASLMIRNGKAILIALAPLFVEPRIHDEVASIMSSILTEIVSKGATGVTRIVISAINNISIPGASLSREIIGEILGELELEAVKYITSELGKVNLAIIGSAAKSAIRAAQQKYDIDGPSDYTIPIWENQYAYFAKIWEDIGIGYIGTAFGVSENAIISKDSGVVTGTLSDISFRIGSSFITRANDLDEAIGRRIGVELFKKHGPNLDAAKLDLAIQANASSWSESIRQSWQQTYLSQF